MWQHIFVHNLHEILLTYTFLFIFVSAFKYLPALLFIKMTMKEFQNIPTSQFLQLEFQQSQSSFNIDSIAKSLFYGYPLKVCMWWTYLKNKPKRRNNNKTVKGFSLILLGSNKILCFVLSGSPRNKKWVPKTKK